MPNFEDYEFSQVSWLVGAANIMALRKKVFVIEQHFDKEVICDQYDNDCYHILVKDHSMQPIACGRLTTGGHIGKIAVVLTHRYNGIGKKILHKLIELAEINHIYNLSLNTETELSEFYNHQNFHTDGPVYMKQGIPFQKMCKKLA